MDLIFGFTLITFKVCWLIYGNTFIYSDNLIDCKNQNDNTRSLWILSVVLLAFGYLTLLAYFIILCCLGVIIFLVCQRGGVGALQGSGLGNSIPMAEYLNAVKGIQKSKFTDIDDKHMKECAICLMVRLLVFNSVGILRFR